jgi:hypothetical protein
MDDLTQSIIYFSQLHKGPLIPTMTNKIKQYFSRFLKNYFHLRLFILNFNFLFQIINRGFGREKNSRSCPIRKRFPRSRAATDAWNFRAARDRSIGGSPHKMAFLVTGLTWVGKGNDSTCAFAVGNVAIWHAERERERERARDTDTQGQGLLR